MNDVYAHRNGENEPPQVIERFYWFDPSEDSDHREAQGLIYVMPPEKGIGAYIYYQDGAITHRVAIVNLHGRWWGPVVPPWDRNE